MSLQQQHRATPSAFDTAGWIALTAVTLVGLALASRCIWAADFWWQWATGRHVAELGWPQGDPFSFSAAGAPWIELRWLFCWVQYRLMEAVGPAGPSLLKIVLIAGAFIGVSLPVARHRNRVWLGIVLAIALRAASPRFFVRPEWVSLFMIGGFVFLLDRFRKTGTRWVYILPLLQVLWVNSHPLFVFGPLLCGLMGLALMFDAAAGRFGLSWSNLKSRLVPLAGTGLACFVASWINPYGTEGAKLPLLLFSEVRESVFQQVITELQSPFGAGAGIGALISFKLLIAFAVVSCLLNLRRLDPFWTFLAASQFYLASLSVRSIPLFCLAAVPLLVYNVDRLRWTAPQDRSWFPRARLAVAGLLALICMYQVWDLATDRFYVRRNDSNRFGWGIAADRYPLEALRALQGDGSPERVIAGLMESSFLLAHEKKVYADPRLEVYGEKIFSEYLKALTDRAAMTAAVRNYDIGAAVVEPGSPAVALLNELPGWGLVHLDPIAAVYLHRAAGFGRRGLERADLDRTLAEALERVRAIPAWNEVGLFSRVRSPKPALAMADFCFRSRHPTCAGSFLDEAERISPFVVGLEDKRAALAAMARVTPQSSNAQRRVRQALDRLAAGDAVAAEELARSVTVEYPDQPEGWALLGRLQAERGNLPQAADAFTQAIRLRPREPVYRVALARIVASLGYRDQAIEGLRVALQLDPDNIGILRGLAALTLSAGDRAAARELVAQGLALAPEDEELLRIQAAIDATP